MPTLEWALSTLITPSVSWDLLKTQLEWLVTILLRLYTSAFDPKEIANIGCWSSTGTNRHGAQIIRWLIPTLSKSVSRFTWRTMLDLFLCKLRFILTYLTWIFFSYHSNSQECIFRICITEVYFLYFSNHVF